MILSELFDKSVEWKWVQGSKGFSVKEFAEFYVNEKKYIVTFVAFNKKDEQADIGRQLEYHGFPNEVARPFYNGVMEVWEVFFGLMDGDKRNVKLTGTGDSLVVFATVVQIVKAFVQKNGVDALLFSASVDEPSRVKMYKTMVRKFSSTVYTFDDEEDIMFVAMT